MQGDISVFITRDRVAWVWLDQGTIGNHARETCLLVTTDIPAALKMVKKGKRK